MIIEEQLAEVILRLEISQEKINKEMKESNY